MNFIKFGELAKEIRQNLNLTRSDVTKATGIAQETLRRLENGIEPKISTIELLSEFYKFDLLNSTLECRDETHIFSSKKIEQVIEYMRTSDTDIVTHAIKLITSDLTVKSKTNPNARYVSDFLHLLSQIKLDKTNSIEACIANTENLLFSLSTIPSQFLIDKYLSDLEIYLAIFLATQYRRVNQVSKSLQILESLTSKLLDYPMLTETQKNFLSTINLNKSYAYHYFEEHHKVIKIVDETLADHRFRFSNTTYNDYLLRKAYALYALNRGEYKAIYCSVILNDTDERVKQIKAISKSKYNICIDDLMLSFTQS